MTKFLLSVHVLAAILAIGPVTVAASMFPAVARRVLAGTDPDSDRAVLRSLHRICRVYAVVGIMVPVFGLATASTLKVLGTAWLIVSIALTAAAAGILALLVLPRQQRILAAVPGTGSDEQETVRLALYTGMFAMLWAVVTVLMIVRPGSTTGA